MVPSHAAPVSQTVDHAALFAASPNAYVVLSRDYTVLEANPTYLALVGRTRDDIVGANLFEAFPLPPEAPNARQHEELRASFDRVFATGRPDHLALIRYAIPIESVEGSGFVDSLWSASHHPIFGADRTVVGLLQFTQNITGLRDRLETALTEAASQAEDAPAAALAATRRVLAEAGVLDRAESIQSENRSLADERLRLLRLFDQSQSFTISMREPEHVVELANPAYLEMVGEDDLRGRNYKDAHRGAPPVPVALLDDVYETGVPYIEQGMALRVPDRAGRVHTIYVDVVIQRIVDADGKVFGVFMQGNDVTSVKAAQDELAAYRTRLEEMVAERTQALERSESERRETEAALHHAQRLEAVGKLTGGVAHDFNNVLQIIRGNLQLAQRAPGADAKLEARLDAALDGVERGAKLASQLLAFGRRQPLQPAVVDLAQVLRRMGDLLRRALGESITIETHVADGLWNVLVDAPRFENVILNVAINARDAMDHRGRLELDVANAVVDDGQAAVVGLAPGDYVRLSIVDSGAGMSEEVRHRAFEPFFTTKPEGEGTGLGLSMVYGFMKQSGGVATLASTEDRGTTVCLYLPRSDEAASEADAAPQVAVALGTGQTILVVEDDEAVRVTTVDTLIELGYRTLRASDGQSALAIIKSGVPIDLLFTDVVMPGPVSGVEMVRQARRMLPSLRVLYASGFTRDAIGDRDRLWPGVELISKPYDRQELAARLHALLHEAGRDADGTTRDGRSAGERRAPDPSPDLVPVATPRRRVLLVEDSDEVRETTVEFIDEVGFAVVAVASAEAALEALAGERFDILFTDVSLPGMSGLDLLKRIRANDAEQRVVLATGYGADIERGEFGPRVAVLGKPYDLATLERTLAKVLADGE